MTPAKMRDQTCATCGRIFRTVYNRECDKCRAQQRTCIKCGNDFKGYKLVCSRCRASALTINRVCTNCGIEFVGDRRLCPDCAYIKKYSEKTCAECGYIGRIVGNVCHVCRRATLTPQIRAAIDRNKQNTKRARKRKAAISGPVRRATYTVIAQSGPCVYCGDRADTVDHICPLSRGGIEHESNLVPACMRCNRSKRARLLTEWDAARVAHAVAASPLVAAEYARLTA